MTTGANPVAPKGVRMVASSYLSSTQPRKPPPTATTTTQQRPAVKPVRPTTASLSSSAKTQPMAQKATPAATSMQSSNNNNLDDDLAALQMRLLQLRYLNMRSKQAHETRLRSMKVHCFSYLYVFNFQTDIMRVWHHCETTSDAIAQQFDERKLSVYAATLNKHLDQNASTTEEIQKVFHEFKESFELLSDALQKSLTLLPVEGIAFENKSIGTLSSLISDIFGR